MNQSLLEWKENISPSEWDRILSSIKGHPLQSAKWGNARKSIDSICDTRWAVFKLGQPICLIRFEERRFLGCKIAWIPKGPTMEFLEEESEIKKELFRRLRKQGFFMCIDNLWREIKEPKKYQPYHYTLWIDLSLGKEKLWSMLQKQCRYDVRRAKKMGTIVERTEHPKDVTHFYELCKTVSQNKNFRFNASLTFLTDLLYENQDTPIKSHLFIAKYEGKLCGGAFVIHCGQSIHYMWGAVDRAFSKLSIGEIIQWEIIEWAISQQCRVYDLEGIDPKKNPGTYQFKKKLGGKMVTFPGIKIYFLNRMIHAIASILRIDHLLARLYA
ncbi:MAG: methicillin resistance protein [uncultured bacterium]|nr:MAG: methicillin resistance protein [uncultured bacterium]